MKGYSASRTRQASRDGFNWTNKVRVIVTNQLGKVVYDKMFEDGPASDDNGEALEAVWNCIIILQKASE